MTGWNRKGNNEFSCAFEKIEEVTHTITNPNQSVKKQTKKAYFIFKKGKQTMSAFVFRLFQNVI